MGGKWSIFTLFSIFLVFHHFSKILAIQLGQAHRTLGLAVRRLLGPSPEGFVPGLVKNPYQNVTFFPRFTFYLTENSPKTPAFGDGAVLWSIRRRSPGPKAQGQAKPDRLRLRSNLWVLIPARTAKWLGQPKGLEGPQPLAPQRPIIHFSSQNKILAVDRRPRAVGP